MFRSEKPLIKIVDRGENAFNHSSSVAPKPMVVIPDMIHDRYASLKSISWWEQKRLQEATFMVVGAGALGNEVLKNLALMGVGRVLIVDFDLVEPGNLSRGVLFRAEDSGRPKAEVAAAAIRALNPDVQVQAFNGNVVTDLGLGVFRRMDAIIGCLDNREARLAINHCAYRLNKPWVDGAIQELFGVARVFWPGKGACYECTLTSADWEEINLRYSCSLINREKLSEGKVPTTPTIASIIAAVQTQEAIKLLHNLPVLVGKGFTFNGLTNFSYIVEYPMRQDCLGHDAAYGHIEALPKASAVHTTLAEILLIIKRCLGDGAFLELDFELVTEFRCSTCQTSQPVFQPLHRLDIQAALCPTCGQPRQTMVTHIIDGNTSYLERTLAEIGVPALHILAGRIDSKYAYFELTGDQDSFLTWH